MLRRFDDDTDVSSPNHQISGFWLLDSFEGINAGVEIRRRRIGIRKPGLLVNAVHQVGAIGVGTAANPGVERGRYQRQPVVIIQRGGDCVILKRPRGLGGDDRLRPKRAGPVLGG